MRPNSVDDDVEQLLTNAILQKNLCNISLLFKKNEQRFAVHVAPFLITAVQTNNKDVIVALINAKASTFDVDAEKRNNFWHHIAYRLAQFISIETMTILHQHGFSSILETNLAGETPRMTLNRVYESKKNNWFKNHPMFGALRKLYIDMEEHLKDEIIHLLSRVISVKSLNVRILCYFSHTIDEKYESRQTRKIRP
jgi:iron only hydrogenase large subunit-like protein